MPITVGQDSAKTRKTLSVGDQSIAYYSIPAAEAAGLGNFSKRAQHSPNAWTKLSTRSKQHYKQQVSKALQTKGIIFSNGRYIILISISCAHKACVPYIIKQWHERTTIIGYP